MADAGLGESVGQQLERILATAPLASSPSLSRFLRFIVEETLAGRGREITEWNLGAQVFNRGGQFNPRFDPIVRVQTHHLRSRLAHYYAGPGSADPIVIELPPRTYVPVFRVVGQPLPPPQAAAPTLGLEPPAPLAAAEPPQPAASQPAARRSVAVAVAVTAVMALVAVAGLAWLDPFWRMERRPTHHEPDPVAQDRYIRGRYLLDRQTESAMRQSIDSFQQATARDPQFAAAFAGLADARNLMAQYGYMAPREGMDEARRAAERAIELDPELAEGHVALACILEAYDWNFAAAEREYRRAIQLDPELPAARLWYGMFLRDQNRIREALPELRRAEQLAPVSVLASVNLAYAFRLAGDFDAALDRARRAVELDPELPTANVLLASIYRARSDSGNADLALDRALRLAPGNPCALALLACTYARLGRREESVRLFHDLQQLAARRYVSPYDLGAVALLLGDEDRAVAWLEEAYRQHSSGMIFLRNDKAASALRSPRLLALIQRIGRG